MTSGETSALDLALRRLDRAVTQLAQRLAARPAASAPSPALEGDLFEIDADRENLKAELTAARERERALEEAGAQASVALGRAIAEIRAALGDEAATANDDHPHDRIDAEVDELFDRPGKG